MEKNREVIDAEIIYYMSGALKNAIDGGFFAREHASVLFKGLLRGAGYEIPKKDTKEKVVGQ